MSHSSTTLVRNRAPLTTRYSSLRCKSAAEHHAAEQYSKTGRTKLRKHLSRSALSWSTSQDFLKIPNLWEAALEAKRRCFSNVSLESNVTPNITRSSDYFSTVPPIVNGGDWGCIVRDLEIIIVMVLYKNILSKCFCFVTHGAYYFTTFVQLCWHDTIDDWYSLLIQFVMFRKYYDKKK